MQIKMSPPFLFCPSGVGWCTENDVKCVKFLYTFGEATGSRSTTSLAFVFTVGHGAMLDGESRVLKRKQRSIPILRESQGSHGVHQSRIEHLPKCSAVSVAKFQVFVLNSAPLIS